MCRESKSSNSGKLVNAHHWHFSLSNQLTLLTHHLECCYSNEDVRVHQHFPRETQAWRVFREWDSSKSWSFLSLSNLRRQLSNTGRSVSPTHPFPGTLHTPYQAKPARHPIRILLKGIIPGAPKWRDDNRLLYPNIIISL